MFFSSILMWQIKQKNYITNFYFHFWQLGFRSRVRRNVLPDKNCLWTKDWPCGPKIRVQYRTLTFQANKRKKCLCNCKFLKFFLPLQCAFWVVFKIKKCKDIEFSGSTLLINQNLWYLLIFQRSRGGYDRASWAYEAKFVYFWKRKSILLSVVVEQ